MMKLNLKWHGMRFLDSDGGDGGGGGTSLLTADPGNGDGQQQSQQQTADPYAAFLGELPPELLDAKPTLEKYKSIPELARAHYSLQTLLGKKANAVVIPGENAKPEEVAAFRKALGIPDKPDDYKLTPEKLPDGVEVRPENIAKFAQIAHQHNIPPAAMKAVVEEMIGMRANEAQTMTASAEAEIAKNLGILKDELWKGQDFAENLEFAKRAARTFGLKEDSPGLSDPYVVNALVKAAKQMSESKLVKGEDPSDLMSGPARAKSIRTNPSDPLYARYHAGDNDVVAMARNLDGQG